MPPCSCSKAAIAQAIDALGARRFGWDGNDALPIRPEALLFARDFLFSEESPLCLAGLAMPEVALNTDGTVEIVFSNGLRELVITIQTSSVATYIQFYFHDEESGPSTIEGTCRFDELASCTEFDGLFRWIKDGGAR